MYTYRTIDEEIKQEATSKAKNKLPEEAELVLLSFTGGRAFGWGGEHHDVDVHGFFAHDKDWFFKCHSMGDYDMTLQNIYTVDEPEIRWGRWKQYYDKSNPIYTHPDFNFEEDFIDNCKPEYVQHIFPYDLHLQFSRLDVRYSIRSALHTYKEMLIPLHFLRSGEIETDIINVVNQKEQYQYEELSKCALKYSREDTSVNVSQDNVWDELKEIYWELAEEIAKVDEELDMSEVQGPPHPSNNIPGGSE
jgi:hypothetical protein